MLKSTFSFSSLKQFDKSPAHLLQYWAGVKKETPEMIFGRYFHRLVLEPAGIENDYHILPEIDRRTKDGKETYQAALTTGKTLISKPDSDQAIYMKAALMENKESRNVIEQLTTKEEKFALTYKGINITGIRDGYSDSLICDLKTAKSSDPRQFPKDAYFYSLHLQAAIYSIDQDKEFCFIAIEKEPPYCNSVFWADEDFLTLGKRKLDFLIDSLKRWEDLGRPNAGYEFWNDYGTFILSPPKWVAENSIL